MKSIHNLSITKQDTKKMFTVGRQSHPVTSYTKDDFLSPHQVAKEFNISTQEALELMKKLLFKRAVFGLNGHKTQIIIRFKNNPRLKLHPMALGAFQEYLNNQKVK